MRQSVAKGIGVYSQGQKLPKLLKPVGLLHDFYYVLHHLDAIAYVPMMGQHGVGQRPLVSHCSSKGGKQLDFHVIELCDEEPNPFRDAGG